MTAEPKKKEFSFGGCSISNTSPKRDSLSEKTKILNLQITFEEALKLNLAIEECLRKLHSYKRSTRAGRMMGLNLAIHLDVSTVLVNEEKVFV